MKKQKLDEYNVFKEQLSEKISPEIEEKVNEALKVVPKIYYIVASKTYKISWLISFLVLLVISIVFFIFNIAIGMGFLFATIVVVLAFLAFYQFNIRKGNILKYKKFDSEKLYYEAFKTLNKEDIKNFYSTNENLDLLDMFKHKIDFQIPINAAIGQHSPLFHLVYNNTYIQFQTKVYYWEVKTKNGTTRHEQELGMIVFNLDNESEFSKDNFNFSLFQSFINTNLKSEEMESSKFTKTFKPKTDDPLKMRMVFTPLTMEESMKIRWNLKSRNIKIEKKGNRIYFAFIPGKSNLMLIDYNFEKSGVNFIVNEIIEDISKDVYEIYSNIFLMANLNLL